jgi:hypothetical protein
VLEILGPLGDVTTIATAPSVSWQQSSSRNGSAIHREFW